MTQPGECNCAMLRPVFWRPTSSAEMIGSARCSLGRIPSYPHCSSASVGLAFAVNSRLNSSRQRRPGDYPQVQSFRHGNQFALHVRSIKLYSICNPVNCVQPRSSARVFACAIHQAERPRCHVENLALANDIVQTAHDFFPRV